MPEAFDAYYKWLAIPPSEQPPNHYRLLGVALFESDADVLASAADKQMAHIRSFQTGQHSALSQKILNEIAAARICLLSAAKKVAYDEWLRGQIATVASPPQQEAEFFDPSQIGFDAGASKAAPRVKPRVLPKQRHKSHSSNLPWQLPTAIVAGIVVSVAIVAYLAATKPPEHPRPGPQAKANTSATMTDEGTKPQEETPPKPEPKPAPKLKPKPEQPEPKPEAGPDPEPQPETKSEPRPEVVELPENAAERVQEALAKAKTAAEFKAVAADALKLVEQAGAAGKPDVAKSVAALALSAARKAEDDELASAATMYFLEPGTKPAVAKNSSGDNQDAASANRPAPRLAVPDATAQEQALKLIREVFKDKYSAASTVLRQKALIQELLQKASASTDDAAAQYVMLQEAARFAIRAKDADLAFQIIDETGAKFEVDALDLKAKSLTSIGKSYLPAEATGAVVGSLLTLMEEAVTKQQFETATELGTMAMELARKSKDPALLKETVARKGPITKEMAEIQEAQAEVTQAADMLAKNPTDPAANLAVGRYRCFVQGKWSMGISMLALGDDPALKDLACKELKGITDAAEEVKLGDAWWDVGEKKNALAKKSIQDHAASWYQQALPGLSGLVKEKVEQRLEKLREPSPEVSSLAEKRPAPIRSLLIEALVDGGSELHITRAGIYWKELGASKPGRQMGRNEPTYVNGKPWIPTWAAPNEDRGWDKSALLPLPIGDLNFGFKIVAIGNRRHVPGIERFSPVSLRNEHGEQVLSIPDKEVGSKWYTVRLLRLK